MYLDKKYPYPLWKLLFPKYVTTAECLGRAMLTVADSPQMKIEIDPDRAKLVGITNADVATSTSAAINGNPVGVYKEGNKNIPIVVRLRPQDRARLSQIENLYVN
jgi:multidrug efflux pump subunit AcrB